MVKYVSVVSYVSQFGYSQLDNFQDMMGAFSAKFYLVCFFH